jgi:hypothetical protein
MRVRGTGRLVGFTVALLFLRTVDAAAQQPRVTAGIQILPGRDRPPGPPVVRVGTGVLKGRVVDGPTGAPVPRARVRIQGAASGRGPVTTDGSGAFAFDNLPAGPITLMVEKSTYMPGRYPEPGRTFRSANQPLILRDGQVMDDVTVPIFRGSAITGRVLDASGDPIDFAQVSVIRVPGAARGGRPMHRGGTQTNDLGEFRVARLDPGTYVLQVSPRRMSMDHLGPNMPGPPSPAPANAPEPLPTFYPSASSIDQAQPILVERGQTLSGIDVMLTEGLPAVITGSVMGLDGQPVAGNGHISVRPGSRDKMFGFDGGGTGIRPDGTFRLTVAPGEYVVDARVSPPAAAGPQRQEDQLSGSVRVSAAGGAEETVSITVGRGATVTGRVVFEGATPPPNPPGQTHVPLHSEDGTCQSGRITIAEDWTFSLQGLSGTCSTPPFAAFGRWMLKAVIHNGENLLDAPYTFQSGQRLRNVQVVVTDRRSDVTLRVADENGQSTREYVALVYPVDKAQWSQGVRTFVGPITYMVSGPRPAPSATLGARAPTMMPLPRRESVDGVRPGEYFVVAVDDMELEDSRDPAVLEQLRASAVRVTVSEGTSPEVALRRVKMSDVMRK